MRTFKIQNLKFKIIGAALLVSALANAQKLSLDKAVQLALQNNLGIKSAESQIDYFKEMKKTGSDIGKLSALWMHGQYNSLYEDNNLTLLQTIPFPTAITNQVKLGKEQIVGAQQNLIVQQKIHSSKFSKTIFTPFAITNQNKVLLTSSSLKP